MRLCNCGAHGFSANRQRLQDPTRTTVIRRRLEQRINALWRRLRGESREWLEEKDFPLEEDETSAFIAWWFRRANQLFLGGRQDDRLPDYLEGPLDEAMEKGAESGVSSAEAAGIAVGLTAAAILMRRGGRERRRALKRRVREEVEGAIVATRQQMRRRLYDERTKKGAIGAVSERMKKVGQNRMRLVARTEVVRANNKGRAAVYEFAEVDEVDVLAEWVTAGDDRVCEDCEDLESRNPWRLSEIEGLLPLHPGCRCAIVIIGQRQ